MEPSRTPVHHDRGHRDLVATEIRATAARLRHEALGLRAEMSENLARVTGQTGTRLLAAAPRFSDPVEAARRGHVWLARARAHDAAAQLLRQELDRM